MGIFIPAEPSAAEMAAFSSMGTGSSGGDVRNILIFGYWPPTDIGQLKKRNVPKPPFPSNKISGKGMLWEGRKSHIYRGYKIVTVTPSFGNPIGYTMEGSGPAPVPFWGKGAGQLMVDYRKTAIDFWSIVENYRPIAIMSFSRGNPDKSWELETVANNIINNSWKITFDYRNNSGANKTMTWPRPYIGGGAGDPAPPSIDRCAAIEPGMELAP